MKPNHHHSPLLLKIILSIFLPPCIWGLMTWQSYTSSLASPYQIKGIFSKQPMKLDSAFKSKAVQVKVRSRGGISNMIRYNYDEYTTENTKHKGVGGWEVEYGFIIYAGKSASRTGFSYMLTDHNNDTAWVKSVIAMNTKFTRAYIYFEKSMLEFESIDQAKNIYSSNLIFNNDTSKWEIIVMDKLRFKDSILPVVIGEITNRERRFLVRLVDRFENGKKAQFAPPGFELIENGNTLMAVQFLGFAEKPPVIWIDPGVDHHTRFILITAASSLIERLVEIVQVLDD